jgi:hypothetical protein
MDIESPEIEPAPMLPQRKRITTRTARLVNTEIRSLIAAAYRGEVISSIRWRDTWKKFGDACEAIAKGLTGVSAIFAFASSAIKDFKTAEILSFTSGAVGTVSLVLLAYSSYAIRESRQRTAELNGLLNSIGVTPVPDIAPNDNGDQ